MTVLAPAVERLLALGADGHHPASAIAGVRTAAGTAVTAAGWAQLPTPDVLGIPANRHHRLDLASVTKVASTTTLAMLLVAADRLRLEASVQHYLPGFHGDGKDRITVEQLLTHTAGLQPWWPLYLETTEPSAALKRVQALPLATAPGAAWRYSDLGLILVGHVVERITSLPLAEAFRRLVAEPLGLEAGYGPVAAGAAFAGADGDAYEHAMISTGVPYPVPFAPEQFAGWRTRPLRGVVNDGNAAHALGGVSGHAGLFSSVDDLLILGAALRGGDFVPHHVLSRFAVPTPIHPEQAVGFRRNVHSTAGTELTLLHHSGFTGTCFAFGIERELVVAGGAMRLHGTLDSLSDADITGASVLASTADIHAVLLHAGLDVLDEQAPITATPAEEQ